MCAYTSYNADSTFERVLSLSTFAALFEALALDAREQVAMRVLRVCQHRRIRGTCS